MRARAVCLSFAGGLTLASVTASAQTFGRIDRGQYESPQNFAVELRVGPYTPSIDNEFDGDTGPYREIFGSDLRLSIGAEFDWQILRIPPVLSLGVGMSAAYTTASAMAPYTNGMSGSAEDWERSPQSTSLTIVPMTAVGVARFDGLARRVWWLPLVPYVKAGVAYGLWWIGSASGAALTENGDEASGGSFGLHGAIGLSLMLDAFEKQGARQFDATVGVNHSYVFAEAFVTDLSGTRRRPQLNVGTASYVFGFAVEF